MKESNLLEEEKSMYATCFIILVVSLFLLVLLGFNTTGIITGAAVGEIIDASEEEVVYEDITLENVTGEEALNAILQAEKDMQEMIDAGFNIIWVNDTLLEAKRYFEGGNYTASLEEAEKLPERERIKLLQELRPLNYSLVLEKTNLIAGRKDKAYEIGDNIKVIGLRIGELDESGLLSDEIPDLFNSLKNEFENERYEDAEVFLERINDKIAEGSAEAILLTTIYKAGKDNFVNFIKENYIIITTILIVIVLISLLSYNRIMARILKKRIQDNEIEKEVLDNLLKKAQKDYFSEGTITKNTYEIKIVQYKKRIAEIKKGNPVLEAKLQKMSKIKRKH